MKAVLADKNTLEGIVRELYVRDEVSLTVSENKTEDSFTCPAELQKELIHFYFCMDGSALFSFGPHYSREIQKKRNYFFYNPEKDLPFEINLAPNTRMVFLTISLEHLHHLFLHDTLPFLKPDTINRKFYDEREIPASLMVVLNQLT
ncbi:MAG: hypothetical protein RIA63_14550, partial [Cyclobacteriaceae bacterium]